MSTVARLIERLKRDYDPDDVVAVHIWCTEDLKIYARDERDVEVTDDEAGNAIEYIDNHVDCELGITWTTIICAVDDILEAREEGEA